MFWRALFLNIKQKKAWGVSWSRGNARARRPGGPGSSPSILQFCVEDFQIANSTYERPKITEA